MKHSSLPRRLTALAVLLCALLSPGGMAAQDVASPACLGQIYDGMAREQRLYRAVLYGQGEIADLPIGSTIFDEEGNSWRKTGQSSWNSLDEGFENTTQTNSGIENIQEKDPVCKSEDESLAISCVTLPRRGIFETRKAKTTEIVPPILQAIRAFQCRLRAVCLSAIESQNPDAPETILVQPPGCEPLPLPRLDACNIEQSSRLDLRFSACEQARVSLLRHELNMTEMAISYDAAYRSMLQFGGKTKNFFKDFKLTIIEPVRSAVQAMRGFQKIPCFSSQCDE